MENKSTFCTVFDCMDGRCQCLVADWCRENLGTKHPDTITKPGMDKFLKGEDIEEVKAMANISTEYHGANIAVVVGHAHCAGNPVSDEQHKQDIEHSCDTVASWGKFGQVIGLFAYGSEDGSDWALVEVCRK